MLQLISLLAYLSCRTRRSPKTGIRICSNRYTEYPVRNNLSSLVLFACLTRCYLCITLPVSVLSFSSPLCSVFSIAMFRTYWGKSIPSHLHFPRELWLYDEVKRYTNGSKRSAPLALLIHYSVILGSFKYFSGSQIFVLPGHPGKNKTFTVMYPNLAPNGNSQIL